MNILHDHYNCIDLESYGIQIPFQKTRLDQIFSTEKDHKIFDIPLISADIQSVYDESLLSLAHTAQYTSQLKHADMKMNALTKTFELFNTNGTQHPRYKPTEKPLMQLADECLWQSFLLLTSTLYSIQNNDDTYALGGGFHHAMSFGGRGFCLVNDIAMCALYLHKFEGLQNIWIIDVDAHKGDGTAEIFQSHPNIHTFSIHMKSGWPMDEGNKDSPWFIPSDLDIPISSDENHLYLGSLEQGLQKFKVQFGTPDMAIIVQGADPYEKDELLSSSLLKLSKSDLLKRDQLVFNFFKDLQVNQTYCMSGGYGKSASEIYLNFFQWLSQRNG